MKEKEVFEIYINGRLYKNAKEENCDKVVEDIDLHLEKKGYEKISDDGDTIVYCNIEKYKIAVIQVKVYIGYKDSKDNKIYLYDVLRYKDIEQELWGTYPFEGYYIRYTYPAPKGYAWGPVVEYKFKNQKDFNETVKVKDCRRFENARFKYSPKIKLSEL